MSLIAARRRRGMDFWPGFVDALSALLMVLVFLLLVFSIGQFVLSDALSGRDKTIDQLNAELSQLAKTLSMEQSDKAAALNRIRELAATLSSTSESRNAFAAQLKTTQGELDTAHGTLEQNEEEMNRLGADLASLQALKVQLESEIAARLAELEENKDKLAVQTELSAKSAAQVEAGVELGRGARQVACIQHVLAFANGQDQPQHIRQVPAKSALMKFLADYLQFVNSRDLQVDADLLPAALLSAFFFSRQRMAPPCLLKSLSRSESTPRTYKVPERTQNISLGL